MVFFKTKKYVDITNLPAKANRNRIFKVKKVKPVRKKFSNEVKPVVAIKRLKP